MADREDEAATVEHLFPVMIDEAPNERQYSDVVSTPGVEFLEISEDALAMAFTRIYGDSMRYDHDAGAWFQWSFTHWEKLRKPVAFHYSRIIGRRMGEGKKTICKATVAAGVERFARADPVHAVTSERWDANPFLLGTPAGVVDLTTGRMKQPNPDFGITKLTGCSPSSETPTLWLKFLHEACAGDVAMVIYLQRVCGYCLTGDTREHALFFIHGSGGNGKSVFLAILTFILGAYAANAASDTFIASKVDKHTTDLAMLKGARGVFASETEEGRAWAEARIASLTGGDIITARFMRQDNFEFKPQFKLMIVGNHAPKLHNVGQAMRRRFNIIPFVTKPASPDRKLEEKLRLEAPSILGWMIRGCLDWQEHGLGRPEAVRAATEDYFDNQDLFGQWLDENCRTERDNKHLFTPSLDLFKSWSSFAALAGEGGGDMKSFSPKLEGLNFEKGRPSSHGKKSGFYGIELNRKQSQDDRL